MVSIMAVNELENPEVAGIVAQYKDGCIGYGEAKEKVILYLALAISESLDLNEQQFKEVSEQAKALLLGEQKS